MNKFVVFAALLLPFMGRAQNTTPVYFAGQATEIKEGKAVPIGEAFLLIHEGEDGQLLVRFRIGQEDCLECPVVRQVDLQYYESQSLIVETVFTPDGIPNYATVDLPGHGRILITVKSN